MFFSSCFSLLVLRRVGSGRVSVATATKTAIAVNVHTANSGWPQGCTPRSPDARNRCCGAMARGSVRPPTSAASNSGLTCPPRRLTRYRAPGCRSDRDRVRRGASCGRRRSWGPAGVRRHTTRVKAPTTKKGAQFSETLAAFQSLWCLCGGHAPDVPGSRASADRGGPDRFPACGAGTADRADRPEFYTGS